MVIANYRRRMHGGEGTRRKSFPGSGRGLAGGRRAPRVRSSAARVGLAAVAMVLAAQAAAWLLRPRDEPPPPTSVAEREYFSEDQIERGADYRSGQLWLFLATLAAQGIALACLALGRPAAAARALERLGARPVLGAFAAGVALALVLTAVAMPTRLWAHERSVDVGLSTQSLDAWLTDAARSAAISAAFAGAGAAILIALVRRFPRGWWMPGTGAVVTIAVALSWLAPVLLAPLFNRFEPLPDEGRLRSRVLALADRAGVDVGQVYRVDASRRVTALNAYVGGLGPTKRVVLYDNLIERADPAEVESVVAHELAHVQNRDIARGLAFIALTAPLALLFVRELGGALGRRGGADPGSPSVLPAYLLALGIASLAVSTVGNQLSREVEAGADDFALELTGEPRALIELQRRLAVENVADPDPPGPVTFLLGTHPPTIERIGAALTFERAQGVEAGEG